MSNHHNDPSLTASNFRPLAPIPPTPQRHTKRPVPHGRITGAEVRAMRQRHRKSQRQLANDLAMTPRNIGHYETGNNRIPYDIYPTLMMWDANNPNLALGLAVIDLRTHEVWRVIG